MRDKTFNGIEKQWVTKAFTSLKKRKPQPKYTSTAAIHAS